MRGETPRPPLGHQKNEDKRRGRPPPPPGNQTPLTLLTTNGTVSTATEVLQKWG